MTLGGRIPQSLSLPVSYSVSQNGYVMNMRILTFTSLILASTATFAGQRCPANRCPVSVCSTTICEPTGNVAVCGATGESRLSYSSGPTTKLFMGKDGTIREVMTHWEALHRVVEAEQLETDAVWRKWGERGREEPDRCRQAANVRRASMDLTRALADLRAGR